MYEPRPDAQYVTTGLRSCGLAPAPGNDSTVASNRTDTYPMVGQQQQQHVNSDELLMLLQGEVVLPNATQVLDDNNIDSDRRNGVLQISQRDLSLVRREIQQQIYNSALQAVVVQSEGGPPGVIDEGDEEDDMFISANNNDEIESTIVNDLPSYADQNIGTGNDTGSSSHRHQRQRRGRRSTKSFLTIASSLFSGFDDEDVGIDHNDYHFGGSGTAAAGRRKYKVWCWRLIILMLSIIALIASGVTVAILTYLLLTQGTSSDMAEKNDTTLPPTPDPAPILIDGEEIIAPPSETPGNVPTEDGQTLLVQLIEKLELWDGLLIGEPLADDADTSSPLYYEWQTLEWMAYTNPLKDQILTALAGYVLERYVIVYLYLSTNGPNWFDQVDFLTEISICEWNNGFPQDHPSGEDYGIYCNTDGYVSKIELGEWKGKERESYGYVHM